MPLFRYDGPPGLTWMSLHTAEDTLSPCTLATGDVIELVQSPAGDWFTPVKTSKGLALVHPDNHPTQPDPEPPAPADSPDPAVSPESQE